MRRTLLRQLTAKLRELPSDVTARIRSLSGDVLESVLDRVLTAATLDELGLGG